jgi:hypothetical protein
MSAPEIVDFEKLSLAQLQAAFVKLTIAYEKLVDDREKILEEWAEERNKYKNDLPVKLDSPLLPVVPETKEP